MNCHIISRHPALNAFANFCCQVDSILLLMPLFRPEEVEFENAQNIYRMNACAIIRATDAPQLYSDRLKSVLQVW